MHTDKTFELIIGGYFNNDIKIMYKAITKYTFTMAVISFSNRTFLFAINKVCV